MSQPGYQRSDDQVRSERAMGEVSDVLLNLDYTLDAARKGVKRIAKDGVDRNAELALGDLVTELQRLRKRLVHDTYYAVEDRLI